MKNEGERRSLSEDLSRLMDGDLPETEATRVRGLIAHDPDVADLWARMNALPGQVEALPRLSPPPTLNRRVRAALRPARPWVFVSMAGAAVAIAAVVVLAFALQPDPPVLLTIEEGTTLVEGDVLAVAGGVPVHVEGRARISLEPSGALDRERGAKEVPMDWTHGLVAAGTAILTVAVLSGTARIGEEDSEVKVEEGSTWRSAPEKSESVTARPTTKDPSAVAVQARIADLEKELEGLRMQQSVMKGRIASIEGVPQAFPENLEENLRPGGFDRLVAEAFQGRPDIEILEINCDEFPCFAVIRTRSPGEDWKTEIGETLRNVGRHSMDTEIGLWNSSNAFGQEEGDLRLASVALIPSDAVTDEVRSRLGWRIDSQVASWKEDLGGE